MKSAAKPFFFKCSECSRTFRQSKALNSHMKELHSPSHITHAVVKVSVQNKENIQTSLSAHDFIACNFCTKTYSSNQSLNEHIRIKHSTNEKFIVDQKKEWNCALCEKSFQRFTSLNKHIRQNHPKNYVSEKSKEANFICNTCDNSFCYRKTLIRHIQDKHPEEMCNEISNQAYSCPSCLIEFEYYVNLKQHIKRSHPNEASGLKEIIDRYFKCDACAKSFLHRYDLTRHKLKQHPTGIAKELAESKQFGCSFCSKRFHHKFNMRLHSRKKHPEEWCHSYQRTKSNLMSCAHCGKAYSGRVSLIHHLRMKHPVTSTSSLRKTKSAQSSVSNTDCGANIRSNRVCPLCSAAFARKKDIWEHFLKDHQKVVKICELNFVDEAAFDQWKCTFEDETKSKFVKYNCYQSKKEVVKIFICHRSGCFRSRSRGFRHLRLTGSEKINGYCPAELKFTHNLATNRCVVQYVDTHIGHGQELQFLKLPKPWKNVAVDSLSDLFVNTDVGDSAESLQPRCVSHATALEPVDPDEKHLIDTIVLSSWIWEHEDCVLYLKGPEESDPDFPALKTDVDGGDFVFVLMNEFQATMYAQYASDMVAVGRMDGPKDYELELFVVMVVDNYRQGIPCCFMLANRSDRRAFEVLFTKLAERGGRIKPRVLMTNTHEAEVNAAWNAAMPAPERSLLCSWYVLRCWEKNLTSRIGGAHKRKAMRRFLYATRMQLNPFRFHEMLGEMLAAMEADAEATSFLEYFRDNFVGNESTWAYCYRKYAGVNTNYVCDRFFQSFRRVFLRRGGKRAAPFSLEETLDALASLLRGQPREKLVREVKGQLVSKIKEARVRHAIVVKEWSDELLDTINGMGDREWYVPSSARDPDDDDICQVERVLDRCDCRLTCRECGTCLHQYRCTCPDNCIQFNMCTHIHAVCVLQRRLADRCASVDLADQVEMAVLDVSQMDVDYVTVHSEIKNEQRDPLQMEDG